MKRTFTPNASEPVGCSCSDPYLLRSREDLYGRLVWYRDHEPTCPMAFVANTFHLED